MTSRTITTRIDKASIDAERGCAKSIDCRLFDDLTDGELLNRFVQRHEEAAFTAILRRHGPMVLSVCRRVLSHNADAEDAFQVTFLVLVEKASRLRKPELLANWLYGVAHRTALHARQRAARRCERERESAAMVSGPADDPDIETRELRRVLDEELHRLPQKYRAPLVLCYLEGKTNQEAARLLGCPSGSMSHRLARGRELLRERLQGRIAGLSMLLPTSILADHLRPEFVSPYLLQTTVQAAVALIGAKTAACVTGFISTPVQELMEETVRDLAVSRWHWWIALISLVLTVLSLGGVGVWVASSLWTSHPTGSCTGKH